MDTYTLLGVNVTGLASALGLLFWLLSTGRLATGRELGEKQDEIRALKQALEVRDRQLDSVLREYLPAANSVMKALHQAGVRQEAEGEHQAAGEMSEP